MYNRSASSRASIRSFLFPCLLFFRGSHTTSFLTCGFSRSYNQVAQVPSSKVTCNSPRSPWIKSRMTFALVLDHAFHHQLSSSIPNCNRNAFFMHVHADIFSASHKRVFLSGGFEVSTQTLLHKGRPFILRRVTGQLVSDRFQVSDKRVYQVVPFMMYLCSFPA